MASTSELNLPDLSRGGFIQSENGDEGEKTAAELAPVFDVPVNIQAVLGRTTVEVSQLLKLGPGAVLELDRRIGEAIDIFVNNRLVARGEIQVFEDRLGVTMTEIIKGGDAA
jgi:flagellar motor switch protein FliN/FliY